MYINLLNALVSWFFLGVAMKVLLGFLLRFFSDFSVAPNKFSEFIRAIFLGFLGCSKKFS